MNYNKNLISRSNTFSCQKQQEKHTILSPKPVKIRKKFQINSPTLHCDLLNNKNRILIIMSANSSISEENE